MSERPSAPVLKLLREVSRRKGLNTATLAQTAGLDRGHLKQVLAGAIPLTVDELLALSQALELSVTDLAAVPEELLEDTPKVEPQSRDFDGPEPVVLDPYGNHAEQALKLAFGLGCDLHVLIDTEALAVSGIPRHVLARYPDKVPLRFDAAWHRGIDPRFLPNGVRLNLSFDTLYDCLLPWRAFHQITFFPLPPSEDEPEPEPEEPSRRGHLRLVE